MGCNLCTGTTDARSKNCQGCKAGYALTIPQSGDGSCALCGTNSGRDADTTPQTSSQTCTATPATAVTGCRVHSSDPTFCITCKAGYHMTATNVCTLCPVGRGKAGDTAVPMITTVGQENTVCNVECTPASNCRTCGSETNKALCSLCADGRFIDIPAGQVCVACTTGCKTCTATGLDKCPSCSDNFYYSAANTCTACPTGQVRTAPATAPKEFEQPSVCKTPTSNNTNSTNNTSNSAGTLIQVISGAALLVSILF